MPDKGNSIFLFNANREEETLILSVMVNAMIDRELTNLLHHLQTSKQQQSLIIFNLEHDKHCEWMEIHPSVVYGFDLKYIVYLTQNLKHRNTSDYYYSLLDFVLII